eukprot:g9912.t1
MSTRTIQKPQKPETKGTEKHDKSEATVLTDERCLYHLFRRAFSPGTTQVDQLGPSPFWSCGFCHFLARLRHLSLCFLAPRALFEINQTDNREIPL